MIKTQTINSVIGHLEIDAQKYINWYKENAFDWLSGKWTNVFYPFQRNSNIKDAWESFSCGISYNPTDMDVRINAYRKQFNSKNKYYVSWIEARFQYHEEFKQKVKVMMEHENFYLVKLGGTYAIFPTCADGIIFHRRKDYNELTMQQMSQITSNSFISENLPSVALSNSVISINAQQEKLDNTVQTLKEQEEDIKNGKCEELKKLQAQMERIQNELENKKKKLLEELATKQAKLEEQKRILNNQIFVLETQIYAIRCYTGEVVDFIQLRVGKRCPQDTPLVLHQKLRYLDEEMGRLCALYDFDFNNIKYFEQFIQKNDEAFNLFCPSEKSVSLIKISKDNTVFGITPLVDNILKDYDVEHGKTIGILIRDGENLWMSWTEEDKITVVDDFFYTPQKVEVHPLDIQEEMEKKPYFSRHDKEKALEREKIKSRTEYLSRYFLFNILQGCMTTQFGKDKKLINLPEGTKLLPAGPYVVYSSADGWIDNNKYPNLSEIIDMCNENVKVGDTVVMALSLHSTNGYNVYQNDERGRGYKNICRGVHIRDGALIPVNFKDYVGSTAHYDTGLIEDYENKVFDHDVGTWVKRIEPRKVDITYYFDNNDTVNTSLDRIKRFCKERNVEFDESKIEFKMKENYYISLLKDDSEDVYDGGYNYHKRKRESRVNFLIESDEYLNVELLNSAWLEYFITSKKTKNIRIGGQIVNYSYLIKYLNIALKYVREREEHEMALLMEAGFRDFDKADWRDALSRYKIKTGRHILKPKWAKQLACELRDMVGSRKD